MSIINKNLLLLEEKLNSIIIGKKDKIKVILTAFLSDGHILIDDRPGTGKTMFCKALSKLINCDFKRVQFSSDTLPSDIVGLNILKNDEFILKKGPIFTNLFLADEINRGSSKTQSALLEAMEEKQVTIDDVTYKLDDFFFVIATSNPFDFAGTYLLPENQLDRFLFEINLGYVDKELEFKIIKEKKFLSVDSLEPILELNEIKNIKKEIENVNISDEIYSYILDIANKTRDNKYLLLGLSTRAVIKFTQSLKAYAYLNNRDFVIPDDVKKLIIYIARHRILLKDDVFDSISKEEIIEEILRNTVV